MKIQIDDIVRDATPDEIKVIEQLRSQDIEQSSSQDNDEA